MEPEEPNQQPVPAPRRLYPDIRKYEYENVSIDAINKTLNINFDNIHLNNNYSDKIQSNKNFLNDLKDQQNQGQINNENAVLSPYHSANDNPTQTQNNIGECKSELNGNIKVKVLTETNDIYGPNANETVEVGPVYATPKPAPRPRKTQNSPCNNGNLNHDIYENILINKSNTSERELSGTVPSRKAPELPPKSYLTAEKRKDRSERLSITSEISTTSSCLGEASYVIGDSTFYNTKISKSESVNTLNSSTQSDSLEGGDQARYKSPSPGDLLKSLGATSKLLSESIGERVALRAKDAKHKLDKNFKNSSQLLSSYSSEATRNIKKVGKRFGTNFTLSKAKDKDKDKGVFGPGGLKDKEQMSYDLDRPQTMPSNDQVFKSISFSSPLQKKAGGMSDLTREFGEDFASDKDIDSTDSLSGKYVKMPEANHTDVYEIPKNSLKKINNNSNNFNGGNSSEFVLLPPAYDDVMASASPSSHAMALNSNKVNINNNSLELNKNNEKFLANCSNRSSDNSSLDLPMPEFPPPDLPKGLSGSLDSGKPDAIYGKLNTVQAPLRQKRKKNYEEIQLRKNPFSDKENSPHSSEALSLKPNYSSAELNELNELTLANEREKSLKLQEEILKAEKQTPQPDRSDSWQYYEDSHNGDGDEDHNTDASSPEPIYINQESTYGRVFDLNSREQEILKAQSFVNGGEQSEDSELSEEGAVGGFVELKAPTEIIKEFDPLESRNSTLLRTDKSNELLLLEHLLEDEVYGTIKINKKSPNNHRSNDDDVLSSCTSEEDNLNITIRKKSANCLSASGDRDSTKKLSIVHQNAQLLSDSMENMLDDAKEAAIKPYLSRIDENKATTKTHVDLSHPSQNRSQWFVSPDKESPGSSSKRSNPFTKLNIPDEESPPSYLEAIGENGKTVSPPIEHKSFSQRFMNPKNVFNNVMQRVDVLKRKSSFKTSTKTAEVKVAIQMIPRPSLSPLLVRHEGLLIRFPSGVVEDILKEMQNRKAILRDRQFQTFVDIEMKNPKESIPLEHITTIQCVSNSRVTDNSTHFYCFEITTSMAKHSGSSTNLHHLSNPNLVMTSGSSGNSKQQRNSHLYGVSKESERDVWMQKMLESLTNHIPQKYTCHYYRAGWCYLKNSITSEWSGTWLVLKKSQRRLIFVSEATLNVEKMDLRKARCIVLKESDESIKNLHVETGPILMIDCPPFTVYMVMASPRETKTWRHIIREVAHNNGFALHDQQLTKYNVPVIVDKCINFVYIHGSMSEGIYRKSGSENNITKLISAFRADAFNVEITRNEYNEHDVANVLKRFMRELPERLLGKLTECFVCVQELEKSSDKIGFYKELIGRLSVVERETLKKIVGHLSFISSLKGKNKMGIQNLTMIWGPSLLKITQTEEMVYNQKEADVLADLIVLYKNLFPFTADEVKKEQEMLVCLQKYYAAAETLSDSVKHSGDLKMWITIDPRPELDKEEKDQVNVSITPTKTALEVCQELAQKMGMPAHQISLHEVILNGTLERPLHHSVKVFETVINWTNWPDDDRKNNYLVVKPIDFLREVQRAIKNLATVTPGKELRFVDNRTKSWKTFQCELRDNKIVVSKKEKNDKTTIMREIFLQSCTAYLGCEKKRDFPWSWAITFVEKTQNKIVRCRDSPYIGHVLAGSEWVDRTIWFSSIWYCLYGDNILPPAEIIIK